MQSTMMRVPLSLNHVLERAGLLFPESEIVSRLPDKSLRRHRYAEFHRRARALAAALLRLGLKKGERVATLSWNHYAHLECYFGIPAAGGVMHTLNLRLAPDDIAFIANHANDRFVIFDYVPHEEDDPIAMCYTSGTTGRPKGVVYSHRSTVIHSLIHPFAHRQPA